jgi:hypothetical protein
MTIELWHGANHQVQAVAASLILADQCGILQVYQGYMLTPVEMTHSLLSREDEHHPRLAYPFLLQKNISRAIWI